jgi:hypothetical protein
LELSVNQDQKKPIKYLKPRLSSEKLKLLIAEFDKIQFLRFGKDFPVENATRTYITDLGSASISVIANGQTKEVPFDLGDFGNGARLLKRLADRIRGAGIWNYEGGQIPENFELWYRKPTSDTIVSDYRIGADGNIRQSFYKKDGRPVATSEKIGTVRRLSANQIRELLGALENAGFSKFRYSTLSKHDGCTNDSPPNLGKRTHINIQINRVAQMYSSLYSDCQVIPGTPADTFEQADLAVRKTLAAAGISI